MKEFLLDVAVLLFIGLIAAGARHLHDGKCEAHDGTAHASSRSAP